MTECLGGGDQLAGGAALHRDIYKEQAQERSFQPRIFFFFFSIRPSIKLSPRLGFLLCCLRWPRSFRIVLCALLLCALPLRESCVASYSAFGFLDFGHNPGESSPDGKSESRHNFNLAPVFGTLLSFITNIGTPSEY